MVEAGGWMVEGEGWRVEGGDGRGRGGGGMGGREREGGVEVWRCGGVERGWWGEAVSWGSPAWLSPSDVRLELSRTGITHERD